jgi:type II secretory pathway pseudopilin PulG
VGHRAPIRKQSEDGFILVGVIILLAIFMIAMLVAAPKIAASIQRDREVETMRRGKQYIRAIQLYYRKFNAYPPSIDALVKTNEIRFLRKRYIDPMTGKDDWKPIMFCQNKAPLAMGFFGQPLGAAMGCGPIAGTGPSGGNGLQGSGMFGGTGTNPGGGIFGSSPTAGPGGALGTNPTSPTSPTLGQAGGTGITPGQAGGTGTAPGTGTTGTDSGTGSGTGTDANGNPIGGQTFGGGGIVGFSPVGEKQSILVYKKMNHYNAWEFTYTPLMDQQQMMGGNTGAIGQPVGGQNPLGTQPGGTGFGPTGGTGGSPFSPAPAPTPTPTGPTSPPSPNPPQ